MAALSGVRFGAGVLCVAAAAAALAVRAPHAFRSFDAAAHDNAWRSPIQRLVHTGEITGINAGVQEAALQYVPPRSTFAVLTPPSLDAAAHYGFGQVTIDAAPAYFEYLLLPARLVPPERAQYVICFGCDTSPWDPKTTWLWRDTAGDSIGRVRGK